MKDYIKTLLKDFCINILNVKNKDLDQLIDEFIEPKKQEIGIQKIVSSCLAPDFEKRRRDLEKDREYYGF